MVLTAYFVLSPATNSSCHRHPRIKVLSKARSGRLASANLTPATGARTTRLCRPLKRRSSCTLADRSRGSSRPATSCAPDALASTASRPAFVTTRDPPLLSRRDGLDMHLIWVRREQKYFCKWGWTGNLAKHELICPSGCREIRDQRVGPGFRGAPSGLRWLLPRHCEERSDEAIHTSCGITDCFARICATRWLAMMAPQDNAAIFCGCSAAVIAKPL